ncbi:PREDICTED: serine protease easter-like [Papilio polytes]|uniref:serine protease easter-like n=1 Tax=Papilio polytes TaxID=76194 RepID=UPI000675F1BF|nr:PREDICTED: serine protease easter-like [Papilio polytes]XP_013147138.1 PREDICTED: serine protease easter-like [Papilio polytes]
MEAKIMKRLDMSRCGNLERHSVCCEYHSNAYPLENNSYENNFAPSSTCTLSSTPPEPQSNCCGKEATNSDRIIGGTETNIDEYPWLVLIEYVRKATSEIEVGCAGSLISGKYVLTAAHCLRGQTIAAHIPVNVRLGEYNISNIGPDCVKAPGGGIDCTENPVVIPIEQTFIHEEYNENDIQGHNDIALIRLMTMAPYTEFIRPICLPTSEFSEDTTNKKRLFASGWGLTETLESMSPVKRGVELPYMSFEECYKFYSYNNIMLTKQQLCAGGEPGKDSCKGDSGGPLMYLKGDLYEVTGVVSFGPLICGQSIPSVYINVYQYLPWIWQHINNS